jgi:hypothetical protein
MIAKIIQTMKTVPWFVIFWAGNIFVILFEKFEFAALAWRKICAKRVTTGASVGSSGILKAIRSGPPSLDSLERSAHRKTSVPLQKDFELLLSPTFPLSRQVLLTGQTRTIGANNATKNKPFPSIYAWECILSIIGSLDGAEVLVEML